MRHIARTRFVSTLCVALVAASCETGGDAALVARAEDYELSVNEAVSLLAGASQLPAEANVVEAVGELWVDYVLLGEAARRDTTMDAVELEPLVRQQVERRLILALRDSVIEADTAVTDTELRALFEEERPGELVEARHILLRMPENATATQQDSVRGLAERVREEVLAGDRSFEALAREYSQDPGSARQGGHIGLIERGQSLPALEEALFSMEPGEVSDVVETSYGLHILRVDQRRDPGFDEISERFRAEVQQRRHAQAESTYIAALLDQASVEPVDEAVDLTRRMAEKPGTRLSSRAARRPVMEYEGGSLTLGEVLDFMQTSRADYRGRILQAPDETVEDEVLLGIVQRELLLQRARTMGFTVSAQVRDSLREVARERFVDIAGQLGVLRVTASPGQSSREAVEARVESILREIVSGTRDVSPLGAVAYALRRQFPSQVFASGVDRAVQRLAEVRDSPGSGPGSGGGPGTATPEGPPTPVPDTSAGG